MTAPNRGRIARGRRTQRVFAELLQRFGWPSAEAVFGSMPGRDILGVPGIAFELKATEAETRLHAALSQAAKHASVSGDIPVVVWRPNGYGEQDAPRWVFAMRVEDGLRLLHLAGFGDGPAAPAAGDDEGTATGAGPGPEGP